MVMKNLKLFLGKCPPDVATILFVMGIVMIMITITIAAVFTARSNKHIRINCKGLNTIIATDIKLDRSGALVYYSKADNHEHWIVYNSCKVDF